ncbi:MULTISPECIES: hypothetical protein [Haloarcula]|uniref:hypothetical protein n=1 Tax=Haloarcula TaxID=2237 RepID=UPI0023EA8A24|nr:hypothetical protein [Halomicroarcula sp. XH51]
MTLPLVAVGFTALPVVVAAASAVGYLRRIPGADRDVRRDAADWRRGSLTTSRTWV